MPALSVPSPVVPPCAFVTLAASPPDAAAGASAPAGRATLLLAGVMDCAAAGVDAANAAARTHDAHDATSIPLGRNGNLNTGRGADTSEPTGERDTSGEKRDSERARKRDDKNNGSCVKRETKREPRRLRDKEIGNVVEGQRNMPEILSPCG
ncbi:conserved protein of unknown function [Paraburkholderia dioscoreae]|uniref:Uncharacterized protein n=1 Tax=Paraburkholderia dioscoreae TaxID=2604047 RepID=A0A5Q4ZMQ9_9BURK|nr:conserved protein of unknown function [Paraburkholderia dioscoreae]